MQKNLTTKISTLQCIYRLTDVSTATKTQSERQILHSYFAWYLVWFNIQLSITEHASLP